MLNFKTMAPILLIIVLTAKQYYKNHDINWLIHIEKWFYANRSVKIRKISQAISQ